MMKSRSPFSFLFCCDSSNSPVLPASPAASQYRQHSLQNKASAPTSPRHGTRTSPVPVEPFAPFHLAIQGTEWGGEALPRSQTWHRAQELELGFEGH